MAITLEANYSKKLGLPAYSSHQYAITVRTEVNDLSQVQEASSHLYRQLQQAVDRDIQITGFLPHAHEQHMQAVSTAISQRTGSTQRTANTQPAFKSQVASDWGCSPKQKSLIEKLMQDHAITHESIEELANARFRTPLINLNKMQASGLIDELIGTYGSARGRSRA